MKREVIEWNNHFPLDKWWRNKYSIPYNSPQHQEVSQIDIYFEWYEDELYKLLEEESRILKEKESLFLKGELLSNRSNPEEDNISFDNLDISQFNIED